MTVGIIGLGLIGGSIGLDLRTHSSISRLVGLDKNVKHEECARRMNIVDAIVDLDYLCAESDIIILATPVNVTLNLLPEVLDRISEHQVVTDMGSSKKEIMRIAQEHPRGRQFVGGHPIAGTEHSGPVYAMRELFKDKIVIVCPPDNGDKQLLNKLIQLYKRMGMKVEMMSPEEHDKHLAYVSHLSHISSFALGLTVLDIEKNEKTIFDLAGSGFESTVRLAKSSPEMWNPIFSSNKENILNALAEYIEQLNIFKELLEQNRHDELHSRMNQANEVRRVLRGKATVMLES